MSVLNEVVWKHMALHILCASYGEHFWLKTGLKEGQNRLLSWTLAEDSENVAVRGDGKMTQHWGFMQQREFIDLHSSL